VAVLSLDAEPDTNGAGEQQDAGELWVFAYGSLMWDPGFEYEQCSQGLLRGYHRDFCVLSMNHRGTPQRPGLVLGLARGGTCRGLVYRVGAPAASAVRSYLFERELRRYEVYRQAVLPVLASEGSLSALTYIVDPAAPGYAGKLPIEEAAERILLASGERGPNLAYLERTVVQLAALGIKEPRIERIYRATAARRVAA
jgi:cation transport protein ChaC